MPIPTAMEPRPASEPRVLLMPEFMSIGGGQMIYLRKALWLRRNGFEVAVASAGGVLEEQLAAAGIAHLTLEPLGAQGAFPRVWQDWGATVDALCSFVDEHGLNLIDAHPIVPILAAREVARRRDVALHFEFLGGQTHLIPSDVWLDEVFAGNFSTYDGGIVEQLQQRLWFPASRLLWQAPLPVDMEPFSAPPARTLRDELGIPGDAFVLLNACRHDADKLAHLCGLVDAVAALAGSHPNLQLVLAGDGAEHAHIRDYALARIPAGRLHMPGMVHDMVAALHGCDALYGMGSVTTEAASAGKPVIVAPAESILVHAHPDGYPAERLALGYFAEYGCYGTGNPVAGKRPSTIAERLVPLIEDPQLARTVAQRGRDFLAEHHHPDVAMRALVARYREDLARPRRRPLRGRRVDAAASPVLSIALALPHQPAAVVAPADRWQPVVDELVALGVEVRIVHAPHDDFAGVDAIVAVGITAGSTAQQWQHIQAAGVPVLLVGEYRDERLWRALALAMPQLLREDEPRRSQLLESLAAGSLAVAGAEPLAQARAAGQLEAVQRAIVDTATAYLSSGQDELAALQRATGAQPPAALLTTWTAAELAPGDAARFREASDLDEPFVLCLGPIDSAHNQALVGLATDAPVVMVGPPDPEYQLACRATCGERLTIVPHHDERLLVDALAACAVVVHNPLVHGDEELLAAIVASGAPAVVSSQALLSEEHANIVRCNPVDVVSLRAAIDRAQALGRQPVRPAAGPSDAALAIGSAVAALTERTLRGIVPAFERALVIVTRNEHDRLLELLHQLAEHDPGDVQYVIVDNGSTDRTPDLLAQLEGDVEVIRFHDEHARAACEVQGRLRARGRTTSIVYVDQLTSSADIVATLSPRQRAA